MDLLPLLVRPMTRLPILPPEQLPPMKPLLWKNGDRQPLGLEQLGNYLSRQIGHILLELLAII